MEGWRKKGHAAVYCLPHSGNVSQLTPVCWLSDTCSHWTQREEVYIITVHGCVIDIVITKAYLNSRFRNLMDSEVFVPVVMMTDRISFVHVVVLLLMASMYCKEGSYCIAVSSAPVSQRLQHRGLSPHRACRAVPAVWWQSEALSVY